MAAVPAAGPRASARRPEWLESIAGQAAALGVALLVALAAGGLIIVGYGQDPITVYRAILSFSFSSPDDVGRVLEIATPLIFSALAVAVCFRAGMFNIGVEGQYLVAMVTASVAALHLGFLPAPVHVTTVLIFAMLGGMAWGAIPAILKVKTGAHEVVTTIMLNGVAVSLVAWALNGPIKYTETSQFNIDLRTDYFPASALVPRIGSLFGMGPSAHVSLLLPLGILAAAVVWFLLRRTRLGYEARAVGSSPGSAQVGGISIAAVQVKTFLISGALAGLVGMQQILATRDYFPQNYEAQLGFTGIAVAFLGQNNPFGIIAAALLWAVLSRGEDAIQIETSLPREIIIILQSILILSVVVAYQVAKRRLARRQLREAGGQEDLEDAAGAEPGPRDDEPGRGSQAFRPTERRLPEAGD